MISYACRVGMLHVQTRQNAIHKTLILTTSTDSKVRMSIQGRFVGIGTWRASDDYSCAVRRRATWICSVLPAIKSDDVDADRSRINEKTRARQ